ncbi:MAG: fibronectin type III domain-containing protein [Candidatus Electrothrix scaldis]|nr:MAG: fibronectin type III domain-containing protein [Candidatus Electrothrix sp. GW3-3]
MSSAQQGIKDTMSSRIRTVFFGVGIILFLIASVGSSANECLASSSADMEKAVRVMRMLTGHEESCTDLDVDGSGKVGSGDAELALKQAAGRGNIQLSLMVATGTNSLELAWLPASHEGSIRYDIHLSEQEEFTPGPATLKKTVTDSTQAEISGLEAGKLYYAVIVAEYSDSSKESSNTLQAKTFQNTVLPDASSVVVQAEDLGLGKYTTDDDITYLFSTGTPPGTDNILIAENVAGGTTLRRVVSATKLTDGSVSVVTSDASLSDVFDRASIYSSMKLVDVQEEAAQQSMSNNVASGNLSAMQSEDRYRRIDWKNNLLSAEQTDFAYQEDKLSVVPQGSSSIITYAESSSQQFTASVTAKFEPKVITEAEWGGLVFKELKSAKVAAKGTLSFNALAKYNFSASGQWEKDWQLWQKKWTSIYLLGPSGIPVYQEITLKMNVEATTQASSEINAQASADVSKSIEIGTSYDGEKWTPYIISDESASLQPSLEIFGYAHATIRLIPSVEVRFYKVASATLTVEPFIKSDIGSTLITDNIDFLAAHPERTMQLIYFDAQLGLESNLAVNLRILGKSWDVLPETCLLGSDEGCIYPIGYLKFFSIPRLSGITTSGSINDDEMRLSVGIDDGKNNSFSWDSIRWEVFPDDAVITSDGCSKTGIWISCDATLTFGENKGDEYTVFASGHGVLGEIGRQFEETTIEVNNNLYMRSFRNTYTNQGCYSPTNNEARFEIYTDNYTNPVNEFSVTLNCVFFQDHYGNTCSGSSYSQTITREISLQEYNVVDVPLNGYDCAMCQLISNDGGYDISDHGDNGGACTADDENYR